MNRLFFKYLYLFLMCMFHEIKSNVYKISEEEFFSVLEDHSKRIKHDENVKASTLSEENLLQNDESKRTNESSKNIFGKAANSSELKVNPSQMIAGRGGVRARIGLENHTRDSNNKGISSFSNNKCFSGEGITSSKYMQMGSRELTDTYKDGIQRRALQINAGRATDAPCSNSNRLFYSENKNNKIYNTKIYNTKLNMPYSVAGIYSKKIFVWNHYPFFLEGGSGIREESWISFCRFNSDISYFNLGMYAQANMTDISSFDCKRDVKFSCMVLFNKLIPYAFPCSLKMGVDVGCDACLHFRLIAGYFTCSCQLFSF